MGEPRYPKAQYLGNGGRNADGQGWGSLPDRGGTIDQIRLVAHTTETTSMPAYRVRYSSGALGPRGQTAPHCTYNAKTRRWYQHNEHHRRVGTLISSSRTGVLGNEIAIQIEIIAYSDRRIAERVGGLWVGDFTDDHYQDLADWVSWCRTNLFDGALELDKAYGPSKDFATFLYGTDSVVRMSKARWLAAGGILTGHGAAPGNTHWDPGVLDLHRVLDLSLEDDMLPIYQQKDIAKAAMQVDGYHPVIEQIQYGLNAMVDAGYIPGPKVPTNSENSALVRAAWTRFEEAKGYKTPNHIPGKYSWKAFLDWVFDPPPAADCSTQDKKLVDIQAVLDR